MSNLRQIDTQRQRRDLNGAVQRPFAIQIGNFQHVPLILANFHRGVIIEVTGPIVAARELRKDRFRVDRRIVGFRRPASGALERATR